MKIDETIIALEDWNQLRETANTIIKNATRDLILWTEVKSKVEKKIKELEDK